MTYMRLEKNGREIVGRARYIYERKKEEYLESIQSKLRKIVV